MNAARRTMRHVDVFSWLTSQRQKADKQVALRCEQSVKEPSAANAYAVVTAVARLKTLDDLLSQLQEG